MARRTRPLSDASRLPEGCTSASSVLAALLDRSVEQIAEAAADVRQFDREAIRAAADVWRLRTVSCTKPHVFHLDTVSFHGPGPFVQVGQPTAACSLDLHRGALYVAASDGWSASVS
ncbi:hypothetical protein PV703_10605 [Streptomyces sp. ME01-24h]|nr:hypothetical protein [Streptomyces sp. ME01-24h]